MSAILESRFDKFVNEHWPPDYHCVVRADDLRAFGYNRDGLKSAVVFLRCDPEKANRAIEALECGSPVDGSLIDDRLRGGFFVDSVTTVHEGNGVTIAKLVSHGEVSVEMTVR